MALRVVVEIGAPAGFDPPDRILEGRRAGGWWSPQDHGPSNPEQLGLG
jgi:hypothetical protein